MADRGIGGDGAGIKARIGDGNAGFGESPGDLDVLTHLLKIEADAAAMVDDAQAEADRRVAEAEKQSRALYDREYGRQAAELDTAFEEGLRTIRADYQAQLEAYRKSLDSIPVDQGRFSALMDKLLAGGRREGHRV
jgi:F0F1-type ATP synthase membrane subunit b/b'